MGLAEDLADLADAWKERAEALREALELLAESLPVSSHADWSAFLEARADLLDQCAADVEELISE